MSVKIQVTFFQRKPRAGFSFSLEHIFEDVRKQLKDKIEARVKICGKYNDGYFTKFYNIFEAALRQSKGVNHITGEVHFLNLLMKKNSVVLTVLDCGMVHRKQGLAKVIVETLYLKMPVKKAKVITAISEVTKQEIIKYTNCPAEKIEVIPVAVDKVYQPLPKAFNADCPNILHIGTGPNKNLVRLIEALEGVECHLTVVGKLNEEQSGALEKSKISYTNAYDLSQNELLRLYHQCDILSFVSTFEGFGMPIIEANCVERAVITSNLSSMPEVAGDAACLVDPYSVEEIRKGIIDIISDQQYREALIEKGKQNRKRFDAHKIALEYYNIYAKINSDLR